MTTTLAALSLLLLTAEPPWLALPPFQASAAQLQGEAAALPPPELTDVDVLLEEGTIRFDDEGRATTTFRLVYRALTREGAERWSEVARGWAPWHQARPEVRARVVSTDGAVHELDPATLVEAGLDEEEEGLYGDRRLLKGPLPAVDAGAVVEEQEVVRDLSPAFVAGTVRRFYVGRDGPVRTIRLRVEAPASLPLAWAVRGGLAGSPREIRQDGRRVLEWRWEPVAARGRPEPFSPPDALSPPHVAVATGQSWQAVAQAYAAVVERQLAGADLAAVAAEVVPRGADPRAAAQAVLSWLRQRLRYTGLELGAGAFVPARPGETMGRRFGDCKDLSLLAVGVLRAAGLPATMALLRADGDAPADLPGLGEFDHALVAVGAEPIFMDVTDPLTPAGELPALLQGRPVLLASPSTTGLGRLPEAPPARNRVDVVRTIRLAESGWADASESQRLTGWLATDQRAALLRLGPGERAEREQELVRSHFVEARDGEVRFEGLDRPGEPLGVSLTGRGTHWAITRADEAEAVVGLAYLLEWLPPSVRPRPAREAGSGERDARSPEPEREGPRQSDLLLPIAYGGSMHYLVEPPAGFEFELPLPEARRVVLGPLVLETRAALAPGGAVTVEHEVSLSRRRLQAAEVEALREGLAPLLGDALRIRFVRTAARLLEAGQGREAVAELKRLIALHPAEARHWNHLAQALLKLGLGEPARQAARRAVALEPDSAWSHRVLATALEHDALGRWLSPGCDLEGALAAQRRAAELDRDPSVRAHLAFLLEHGDRCERFGEGARLDEAAALYRFIRVELRSKDHDAALLAVLLRAGRFGDAAPVARDRPDGTERRSAQLAIRAATEGVELAVKDALRIPSAERAAALDRAAQHLLMVRRYGEASRLLDGGAGGTPQSAQLKARAATLARLAQGTAERPDPAEPTTLLPRLLRAMAEGGEAWRSVPEVPPEVRAAEPALFSRESLATFRQGLRATSGLPEGIAIDTVDALLETRVEGDPSRAMRLVGTLPSVGGPLSFLVVKEPPGWRLVTEEPVVAGVGAAARRLVEGGDVEGGRAALALARLEAGEPAEGRPSGVLAALAPLGRELAPGEVRLAAAALEAFAHPDGVRALLAAARQAAGPAEREALGWALLAGAVQQGRWAEARDQAAELLAAQPASERAFSALAAVLLELDDGPGLERAVAARLEAQPGDQAALRARLGLALRRGDVAAALAQERALVAGGRAAPGDLNNLAWAMLFVEPVDAEALELARRAVELTRDREGGFLHTLAAVHAVRGEAAEALQVLRRSVERSGAGNLPSPHDWLVVGLVAERYGLVEDAVTAYRRVTPPERPDGLSSQVLAGRRLKALGAAPTTGSAP